MSIKNAPTFQGGSFSRTNMNSFSDNLRLKQQQKQWEAEQAMKQAALDYDKERQAKSDAIAQQKFEWEKKDRENTDTAANIYGSLDPVSNTKDKTVTDIVTRSKEEQKAIADAYQGQAGNELLANDPRAKEIEKRLAELTPQIANEPVMTAKEREQVLGDKLVAPVARAGEAISGTLGYLFSGDTLTKFDENGNVVAPKEAPDYRLNPNENYAFTARKKLYDDNKKEFDALTKEYTQLDKDLRTNKGQEILARVGSTYATEKNVKDQKTGVDVRKEYSVNIDKELEKQKVPVEDRSRIKAILMDKVDPFVQDAVKERSAYDKANNDLKKTELENLAKITEATLKKDEANYKALSEANKNKVDSIDGEIKFLRTEINRNDISDETRKRLEADLARQRAQREQILNTY